VKIKRSVTDRVTKLEEAFTTHLVESGEIRADLAWVKKAIWAGVAAGGTATAGILIQLFITLVKR
jgi:hypothetical protein